VLFLGHGPVVDLAVSAARGLVAATSDAEGLRVAPIEDLLGGAAEVRALVEGATHATIDADGSLTGGFSVGVAP
jgi:hypothetical protein